MSNALLAQIHIAKKDLGLDDATYRDVLHQVAGKESARDLSDRDRRRVIDHFREKGWTPARKNKKYPASRKAHVRKIYALWWNLGRSGKLAAQKSQWRAALCAFVERMTGIDNPEWLNVDEANIVIEALKDWTKRGESK
tara:strand:- start:11895 stop:12311 length:417 start_codon:yes stop_codon:yes gene_type:complete